MKQNITRPEFLQRFAPSRIIGIILGLMVLGTLIFTFTYNFFVKKDNSTKPQNYLKASSSSVELNALPENTLKTIKQRMNLLNPIKALEPSNSATYKYSPNKVSDQELMQNYKDEEDNKIMVIGKVPNLTGGKMHKLQDSKTTDPDLAVPPIVSLNDNNVPHTNNLEGARVKDDKYRENMDIEKDAINSPTKISLNFSRQSVNLDKNSDSLNKNTKSQNQNQEEAPTASIESNQNDDTYSINSTKSSSKYVVKAGTYIPAILQGGINSDAPALIIARVRQNIYDTVSGKYLIIPKNATLIGSYTNAHYGQERLIVAWHKLIYPNGSEIILKNEPGADQGGFGGLNDKVNNHYWSLFGDAFILSVIAAGISYNQQNVGLNNTQNFTSALSQSSGQMLGQTATSVIQKGLNIAPTLTIRNGYNFNILLTQDLKVPKPYVVKIYGENNINN